MVHPGRCQYVAGEKHGYSEEYRNGTLYMDWLYSHGTLKKTQFWRENGKLLSVYHYQDGREHGIEQHYAHIDGSLSSEYTNYKGKSHGPHRQWSNDGQVYCEGNYKHGKKHGKWTRDGMVTYYYNDVEVRR